MKKLSITAVFAILTLSSKIWAMPKFPVDEPKKIERVINVGNVFVSSRMDRNDASVFISGQFPSSCYEWSRATVNEVEEDKSAPNIHVVRAYANVSQGICLPVLTPYTREITLGYLADGQHTIKVLNGDGTYQQLIIDVK